MKLALVTTAQARSSAVGAHAAALAAQLASRVELSVFVESPTAPRADVGAEFGVAARSVLELRPREFDALLFTVGDEACLGFVAPLVRALGGTVLLHDWALPALARAAYPELAGGDWRAWWRAAREGGLAQAREVRAGGAPALNRSIVRFADSFLVHGARLEAALLEERNAPTPIGVAEGWGLGAARALECGAGRWGELAELYLRLMQRFPRPRSSRRAIVAASIDALVRRRAP